MTTRLHSTMRKLRRSLGFWLILNSTAWPRGAHHEVQKRLRCGRPRPVTGEVVAQMSGVQRLGARGLAVARQGDLFDAGFCGAQQGFAMGLEGFAALIDGDRL